MAFSKIKTWCCLITIIGCYISPCAVQKTQAQSNSFVIATVDGAAIYQHQIEIRPEEVEMFASKREIEKLDAHIKKIIEVKAIQSLGIHVEKDDVEKAVDSTFKQAGIDENQARRISETYRALLIALEKWHKDETQSSSIYAEELTEYMTEVQWDLWRESYPSSKGLTKLKALIPKSLDDMKENSLRSSERDLLHVKLVAHITKGVRVHEEDIRATYVNRYGSKARKPLFSEVRDDLKSEILERKKQEAMAAWWQARLQDANIQIKNKRLRELWQAKHRNVSDTTKPQKPVVVLPPPQSGS